MMPSRFCSSGSGSGAAAAGAGSSASISISLAGAAWPPTWRFDSETRRRETSTSITFTRTDSPVDDHLLGRLDVLLGQLGDVHEALDPRGDADERSERHELGDLALDDLAGLVLALELLPGILLGRLERERHALALEVDVEHLDLDLLADLDDLARMVDVLPAELGDVHEPVDPAEIDERAEVHDRGDGPLAPLALRERLEELLAPLALGLLEEGAAREHDVVAVAVELDDLALELGADERVQVAHPPQVDERGGQEPAKADVQDEPALDDLDHRDR